MQRKLTVAALLLWMLLTVALITPTAVQAQDVTLTLSTDQATYTVGSHATIALTLASTTPMSGEIGWDALGCDWNIVLLDATGTEVFNARQALFRKRAACPLVAAFTKVPPPIEKRATILLQNNLQAGDSLPPRLYTVRATLEWTRTSAAAGSRRSGLRSYSAEVIIEITP